MDEFLIAMLAAAGATLTGRSLLFLFDRVCGTVATRRPAAEIWGTSILLGVSFTAASGFVWCDMGQELGPHFSWRQVIIGGLLGILAEFRSRRLAANSPPLPVVPSYFVKIPILWIYRVIVCVALLSTTVLTLRNTEPAEGIRQSIEDKARILFESRTTYAPELVHPEVVTPSSRDPLMIPLFERHVYALLGRECQPWARIWAPLTYVGLLLSFIGTIGRRVDPAFTWLNAAATTLFVPIMCTNNKIINALPVFPAVCFHGVAILYLWDAWLTPIGRERIRKILLASAMASSVCFIRNDGVSLLLADCISWSLAIALSVGGVSIERTLKVSPRRNLVGIVYFALFAAFLLTPWMRYRTALPSLPSEVDFSRSKLLVPSGMILIFLVFSFVFAIGFNKSFSQALRQLRRSDILLLTIHICVTITLFFLLATSASNTVRNAMGTVDRHSIPPLITVCVLQYVANNR